MYVPRRDNGNRPSKDWRVASYHEASHAILFLAFSYRFTSIEIYQSETGSVVGSVQSPAGNYNPTAYACCCLAGPIGEARYTGIALNEIAKGSGETDFHNAARALGRAGRSTPKHASRPSKR